MPQKSSSTLPSVTTAATSRRHPEYARNKPHWDFLEATYRGGREWFSSNIFQYIKESPANYNERVKRSYRFNHSREVVDLITKYVFKGEIKRDEDAPEELVRFWKSATKRDEDIETLMREVSRMSSVFGQPYLVIDSTANQDVITEEDQQKSNSRVFAYVVKPQNVLDVSYDDFGNLNWVLIYESNREDKDFFTSSFDETDRYRLWTKTDWYLYEASKITGSARKNAARPITPIKSGFHGLGLVPVIPLPERDSENLYVSPGMIDDIAYLDRAVANYLSNLDAIIQDQTFSQLTIPAQNIMPGDDDYNRVLELGTKNVLVYDAEGGSGPAYISPDPTQAGVILGVITKIITEIYHSVGMAGERTKMDNAAGIDNSSGVAKAYDFDRMNTMLKAKADRLAAIENRMARIVMAWHSKPDFDDAPVSYPSDFDTRHLYDEFEIAERLALLPAPPELRRHQMRVMVDKLYPQLTSDLRKKIRDEIDNWASEIEPVDVVTTPAPEDSRQGENNKDLETSPARPSDKASKG